MIFVHTALKPNLDHSLFYYLSTLPLLLIPNISGWPRAQDTFLLPRSLPGPSPQLLQGRWASGPAQASPRQGEEPKAPGKARNVTSPLELALESTKCPPGPASKTLTGSTPVTALSRFSGQLHGDCIVSLPGTCLWKADGFIRGLTSPVPIKRSLKPQVFSVLKTLDSRIPPFPTMLVRPETVQARVRGMTYLNVPRPKAQGPQAKESQDRWRQGAWRTRQRPQLKWN